MLTRFTIGQNNRVFNVRYRVFTLLFILSVFSHSILAQSFGGTPNRLKFRQIENDTIRVVFPEGLEYWGQRVANLSMYQASKIDSSLSSPPFKTTIIIRNTTTLSNGFVAYAPYRSEYFSTPPLSQYSGVSPWIDLLHIHEYRHIIQESKVMLDRKWAPEHILFGQSGWSVVNFALLPDWYFEGDAVKVESLYTLSGRGRVPLFYMQIPALRASGKKYNFEKMRAGSFKDPVPNHYVLGYHMTSFLEMEKGNSAWDKVTTRSIKKYALISRSTKKLYGLNNRELYAETVKHLDDFNLEEKQNKDSLVLNYDYTNFTSYELPKNLQGDSILYLRSDYKRIPAFYIYDGKEEKKLFEPNIIASDHWYDINENKVIWTEYVPNALWQNEDYSSLKILDITDGKAHYLGDKKKKYFYPLWSESGDNIAVIEQAENTLQYLVLLDKDANLLKRLEMEQGIFISSIVKVDNDSFWVVKNENEQSQLISINIETGESKILGPKINALIRHPFVKNDDVFFSTSIDQREQIVRLNTLTQELEVLSDATFRALDPMIKSEQLYYVSYEGAGYTIRKKDLNPVEDYVPQSPKIAFYDKLSVGTKSILQDVPNVKYKTSKFKKSNELFEIHSWIPQVIPPNFGLTLLLENKIGTFSSELTYVYNTNEGASQFSARVNYAQVYPKLFVGASHTLNRNANYVEAPFDQIPGTFSGRQWDETAFNAGFIAPFYLNRGKWSRYLSIEGSANYQMAYYNKYDSSLSNLNFPFANSRLYAYNLKKRARRQIYSRWGQSIVLDYSQSFDPAIASQFYFVSSFYFPGLFNTHSLSISPSYKYEPIDNQYNYLDGFPSSYGYTRYRSLNSYRVLVKYTMPLWYPDLGIPGTVFFQRLYGSAFYDESFFTTPGYQNATQRSVGLELNVNMVLLRIFPFEIGVRGIYLLDPETNQDPLAFEVLFYGFSF